jgi:alpha-glucuronidase
MINAGDVVSYLEMCADFGVNLQRGMNFRLRPSESLILMSLRPGAPYADGVEDGGRVIIYEGHDVPLTKGGPNPKGIDQPEWSYYFMWKQASLDAVGLPRTCPATI